MAPSQAAMADAHSTHGHQRTHGPDQMLELHLILKPFACETPPKPQLQPTLVRSSAPVHELCSVFAPFEHGT